MSPMSHTSDQKSRDKFPKAPGAFLGLLCFSRGRCRRRPRFEKGARQGSYPYACSGAAFVGFRLPSGRHLSLRFGAFVRQVASSRRPLASSQRFRPFDWLLRAALGPHEERFALQGANDRGPCLTPSPPPQVMRDTRLREGTPGTEVSLKDKEDWQTSLMKFFGKKGENIGEQKRKGRAKQNSQDRMASLDWCRAVDNALRVGFGKGLEMFNEQAFDRSLARGAPPPTLCLCMDQCQTQWCGYWYLCLGSDHRPLTSSRSWISTTGAPTTCGKR